MPLSRLDITDFRNLAQVSVAPLLTGFNLIHGLNGSGKTSMLEAIYYLSIGRSFRTSLSAKIIRNEAEKFHIFAQKQLNSAQSVAIGMERPRSGELKIRIASRDVSAVAELADLLPVLLINSHRYNLLEGGPLFRRKYLDWGVFYLKNEFYSAWRQYCQVLKQRNAALAARRPLAEVAIWTEELILYAHQLDSLRREYVEKLQPFLDEIIPQLLNLPGLKINYYPGWDDHCRYQDILHATTAKDLQLGYTQLGPHRADFKIKIHQTGAKDILSRGQQKLFVCAMILAQGALLQTTSNKKVVYLIDDLPAELDPFSRNKLITLLAAQATQIFVSAVEPLPRSEWLLRVPVKMFHVEQGNITEQTDADVDCKV